MSTYVSLCDQCNCISTNNTEEVHWLEKDFCDFNCLENYFLKSSLQCHDCKTPLSSQKLHIIESSTKEHEYGNLDYLMFCSLGCKKTYQSKRSLCSFCSAELNDRDRSTASDPMTAFCSAKCENLMNLGVKSDEQAKCSNCHQLKEVEMELFLDDVKYVTCSEDCLNNFKGSLDIENEFCRQCWHIVDDMPDGGLYYVISEEGRQSSFCSSNCMVSFILQNEKAVKCGVCGTTGNFYQMIRGSDDENQAWCSLFCLLKHQFSCDENQANQKVKAKEFEEESEFMDRFLNGFDENNNATAFIDETLSLSDSEKHGKNILEKHGSDDVLVCSSCDSKIALAEPFFQWNTKSFCSSLCVDFSIRTNDKVRCWACENLIAISDTFVYTEYIENELRHFCSNNCLLGCLAAARMCIHCQKQLSDENKKNAKMLCSEECEENYRRIFSNISVRGEDHCTDCKELKPVKFNMNHNGKPHPFCSFTCLTDLYGIPTDSCRICKNYFINTTENFDVFYGVALTKLCSKICRSHFIRKHQLTVSCSFCDVSNLDSYMLQSISERGAKVRCFCSKSCHELFVETTAGCLLTDASEQTLEAIWEKLKKEQESLDTKFKTVSTQTDDAQAMCTCQSGKDEARRILVPTKRLNKDQNTNKLIKVSRS